MTSFWWCHQITSSKIRHQNDVTKCFHFQAPLPLSKVLVAPLSSHARKIDEILDETMRTIQDVLKVPQKYILFLARISSQKTIGKTRLSNENLVKAIKLWRSWKKFHRGFNLPFVLAMRFSIIFTQLMVRINAATVLLALTFHICVYKLKIEH